MKKTILIICMVLLLGVMTKPADALYQTTADMSRNCISDKRERIAACLNYIAGIIDYHLLMQSLGTNPTIDFCLPDDLKITDAAMAVMNYLRTHPQHDDFIASAAVPLALNKAYPCRPPPPKKKKRR
ncbi:MAG: Rap1a/Tai family immunity protein [Alphaproteobacteria bacterium]